MAAGDAIAPSPPGQDSAQTAPTTPAGATRSQLSSAPRVRSSLRAVPSTTNGKRDPVMGEASCGDLSQLPLVAMACLSHAWARCAPPSLTPLALGEALPPGTCEDCRGLFSPTEEMALKDAQEEGCYSSPPP